MGVRFKESPLFRRVHEEDLALVHAATAESVKTGEPWACDFRIVLPKKGTRWLRGESYAEKKSMGRTSGMDTRANNSDFLSDFENVPLVRHASNFLNIRFALSDRLNMC
ncbi:PAS domain-containing protein [Pseudomonas cyclaminis]|uniref:PAS domain-containing protein n=1 Tax=Pseudomonas cyclaminis TaxID=2781239 RepID=UPI003CC6627C